MTIGAGNLVGFEKLSTNPKLRSSMSQATLNFLATFPADMPEVEVLPIPAVFGAVTTQENCFESAIALMTTSSRGSVTLKSADTSDNPIVDPAWLTTKEDQELAVAGLKRAREFGQAVGDAVIEEYAPGPAVQTDAQVSLMFSCFLHKPRP